MRKFGLSPCDALSGRICRIDRLFLDPMLINSKVQRCLFHLIILSLLPLGQGCASIAGSEREEIKPFAQTTVDVLVIEDIQIRDNQLIYLRRYVDDSFVQLDELQRYMRQIRLYKNKLVEYSIDLVRLTEEYEQESERVAAYASHLEQMVGITELNQIGVSEAEWSEILTGIRSQDTFLNALRGFQPLIIAATVDFAALITRIESELLEAMRKEFDRRIESSFREVNHLRLILHNKRKELLAAMIAVERYRAGNKNAIANFRQTSTHLDQEFTSDTPDQGQLELLELDLRERIRYSTALIAETDGDYAIYEKTRTELNQKETEILEALTIARLQIETWTQAHHALSRGVKKPGELMQLTVNAAKRYLIQ